MTELLKLGSDDLAVLADALESKRIYPPYATLPIQQLISAHGVEAIRLELLKLNEEGLNPTQISRFLRIILQDRSHYRSVDDLVALVTTGPEGDPNRDTSVVVRDLFKRAKRSVLVVGYAVYQGRKVFEALANRMIAYPEIQVRMLLDIRREISETSPTSQIVKQFSERFSRQQWPEGHPLPRVYYYPAATDPTTFSRASLHAKCVVVDDELVFVSSANFTEAAQHRNIEMGLLVESKGLARRILLHFDGLIANNILHELYCGHA